MRYLADTIVGYVAQECALQGTYRFVLPSYPVRLLLHIGKALEERFSRVAGRRVRLVYGIAYGLGQTWQRSGSLEEQADLQEMRERRWYNEGNNLTSLRNRVREPSMEDTLVTLLAGYDHIDDRASLQDFFHLDDRSIWQICLRGSFQLWVEARLLEVVNVGDEAAPLERIAEVLRTAYEQGLADLPAISTYLERLDVAGVSTGSEALRLVLGNLGPFKLPAMPGLARGRGRRRLADYVGPAQEFLNYGAFLDASARAKAVAAVRAFRASDPGEPDEGALGAFRSLDELLRSLEEYIETGSDEERERLLSADFTYIHDKVLGFRPKKNGTRSASPRRLRGIAPEVFLRALWLTLGEYGAEAKERAVVPEEDLHGIALRSLAFKHDFDGGEDGEWGVQSDKDLAAAFLRKALGGIDAFLEQHIQLGEGEGREPVKLQSSLAPGEQNTVLAYQKTHVGEPTLRFVVILSCGADEAFKREFLWCLPQNHPSRLLVDLADWALKGFARSGNALPAYAVPYMSEVFLARDSDEVTRVVSAAVKSEGRRIVDLLSAEGIEGGDPALTPLHKLSIDYQSFLRELDRAGLFAALEHRYDDLRRSYAKACEALLDHWVESSLQPLLLKAFLLVDGRDAGEEHWKWDSHLECAVASPLHPAVLDMIRHQHSFLCESLCVLATDGLREPGGRALNERAWDRIVDLAQIERPVFCTLKDSARAVDSNVRSYGYLHLVGRCRAPSTQLSARLLLEYQDEDEEEITDADLFRASRTSALVRNTLLDYRALHSHADDGLSIGAYCGREVQPIIAGIDAFLERILPERGDRPYALQITVLAAGRDDSSLTRWLDAWRGRWQEADLTASKRHYENCRIGVAYRVVPEGNREELARVLRGTEQDVMFFMDFVEAGASRFEDVASEEFPDDGYRQFPVLEKACCAVTGGGKAEHRERILSHRRFRLATLHAEVMARVARGRAEPELRHVVLSENDFYPWESAIGAAHQSSAWVVCLDPTVDDQLLRKAKVGAGSGREIIGFGTGVGAHGENNYTVSTEQYALADVKRRIGEQLSARLGPWESSVREQVAESLISEASGMAGLSVVKATGPSEYVRDFAAYAVLRKLLPRDANAFCDEIISLDAFRHWFDDAESGTRPDLLRLRAQVVNGYLEIEAQVLECKLAQSSEGYLSKAYEQVAAGLTRLVGCFRPRRERVPIGIDDRPDQRYWWMQLHRLLASRGATSRAHRKETLNALERLAEGLFTISWWGAVVAFWTDVERDNLQQEAEWPLQVEGDEVMIPALTAGGGLVRKVCQESTTVRISFRAPALCRTFRPTAPLAHTQQAGVEALVVAKPEQRAEQTQGGEQAGATKPAGAEAKAAPDVPVRRPEVVEQVLLGGMLPGGREVFWEFGHPEMPNRHILVFGASGTGKTYTIQALLCELGKAGQNALIVDYTNGFTTAQLEEVVRAQLKPQQHTVRREPLPINPFRQQVDLIDEQSLEEDPSITAQRVRGVFSEVYQLGDQQKAALYTAVRDGLTEEGTAFNLGRLVERLRAATKAGGPVAGSAATVLSRIEPFVDMHPFGEEDPASWEKLFTDTNSRCHVIQLAGFGREMAQLITEFCLIDLYRYYRTNGSKDRPRVVVLDEIQNLDHSLDSPLGQLLTEGRKFGISLVLATQTLSSLDRDARDRLFQASHKLFFKPADTELRSFAQILENATSERAEDWVRRLSSLARGQCYSLGPARNDTSGGLDMKKCLRIQIRPLSQRF